MSSVFFQSAISCPPGASLLPGMASRAIPSVNGADSQAPSRADPPRAELLASRASRALDSYPAANSLVPISEAHKGLYDPCIFEPQGDEGKALIAPTGHCAYYLMTTTVLQSGVKWAEAVMFVHITVSKELSGSNPSLAKELAQKLSEGAHERFVNAHLQMICMKRSSNHNLLLQS